MQTSVSRTYVLVILLLIGCFPSSVNAEENAKFQLSNAVYRLMVASNFCNEVKSAHIEAELSVRLGNYENWKIVFAKKLMDGGAGLEIINEFLRYFDGVFEDGAKGFDDDICQAFAYTGFSEDYWQTDLHKILKNDASELKLLDEEGVRKNIEQAERVICVKAKEFWQWNCPIVEY